LTTSGLAGLEHPVHDRLHVVVPRKGFSGRDPDWRSEHLSVCLVYANEDVTRPAELREQNVAGHGAILPMAPRRAQMMEGQAYASIRQRVSQSLTGSGKAGG
jgi:hypothetical protein